MDKSRCIRIFLVTAVALLATPAGAAEPGLLTQPFFVSLGTFIVGSDTKVQLAGESGIGDEVDLDRTFGDADETRLRLDAWWRFAERHKLRALWFDADTSRTRSISEDIDWGDAEFPVGASVTMQREFSIYELAYEYAFLKRPSYELTASAGLHYTTLSVNLAADLVVDGQGETRRASDTARLEVPLPVIGFRGLWNPGGDFWIDASAQFFSLSIDEYDGRLDDLRIAALWQPRTWLGIGVGYNAFTVDVDIDRPSFNGSLEWEYAGPQIFVSGSF